MIDSRTLWTIFVDDGGAYAGNLTEIVSGQARQVAGGDPLDRTRLEALAVDAYRIATLASLMGVEEIARLAQSFELGVARLESGGSPHVLLPPLALAAEALASAFDTLARPDASGARTEAKPLDAAQRELEAVLGGAIEPAAIDMSLARAAAMAARAVAATAHSASAAAAAAQVASTVGMASSLPAPIAEVWQPTVDEDMIDLFFEEAEDRLEGLAQKLVHLEERPDDVELVREIFRDLHTLKGSSGMVGLQPMNRLAHIAEDLVGQVRDGSRRADRPLVDALLAALDALRTITQLAQKKEPIADADFDVVARRLKDPGAVVADDVVPMAAAAASARLQTGHKPAAAAAGPAKQTLRVDFDKLDLLLNLVGELVLGKAGLTAGIQSLGSLGRELESQRRNARRTAARKRGPDGGTANAAAAAQDRVRELGDELGRLERVFLEVTHDLDSASGRLDHVSDELRDQVMKLRMLPIAGVFRKYHRTVRDLAHTLGKKVRLELVGEDTELDKILVEQLDDPLMHLVRNSVDHGIERPDARVAAGKDPEGTVRLSAYHRGNQIVIEISDDGGGMDPARLRKKAREKELVPEAELAAMDDREVLDLIFRPGFSTATRVSEVSGRGVGMDVVRTAIVTRLKGTIDVSSKIGVGTTFTLRLPLTLAIIQVLLARAGGEVFAVPLDVVTRTLTARPADVKVVHEREVLAVRDKQVPLVRLRDALELEGVDDDSSDQLHIILVETLGDTYGLVCERLLGKQEIVIKTLGELLEEVPGAAGATLLGDRCALILDVPTVIGRAIAKNRPARVAASGSGSVATSPADSPGRLKVLLVEDSDTIRESLRRLLEGAGFAVTEARDGAEGLRLAQEGDFDLVSTDVMMPNMDGYELTRALRATERYRDRPIVMVTSRGEKIDRVRGFDAGVDEYITKPHDRQELLRAVQKHLARKQGTSS